MRVGGLMSGASHDGVHVAAADLRLEGDELFLRPRGHLSMPYPAQLRAEIAATLPPARIDVGQVCRLHARLGRVYAVAASAAVEQLCAGEADLIVSHGQTIFHWVS